MLHQRPRPKTLTDPIRVRGLSFYFCAQEGRLKDEPLPEAESKELRLVGAAILIFIGMLLQAPLLLK
jgi:hypothetical protein